MFGANIFNSTGGLVFSTTNKSLVHLATLSPRNYGGFDNNGYVDFEIPAGVPDDVIPFVSYTGSSPSAVSPIVVGVVNPGHHCTALWQSNGGNRFFSFSNFFSNTGIMISPIGLSVGQSATVNSTLTMTFDANWTTWGMPSSIVVSVPANSRTMAVAKLIAQQLNTVAAPACVADVNYTPSKSTTNPNAAILVSFRGLTGPAQVTVFGTVTFSWSVAPQSGLAFVNGNVVLSNINSTRILDQHTRWSLSNNMIIPAIGDVFRHLGVEYTVTGLSGTPSYGTSLATVSAYWGPVTVTTSPPMPAQTTGILRPYRITTIKRYIRVFTGNVASENNNHKCYLFGQVQPASKTGYGMQLYDENGDLTFDSNQRPLVLAARGEITPPFTVTDTGGVLRSVGVIEGSIPSNYAVNVGMIGQGVTQYGRLPTGIPGFGREAYVHLRRASSTSFDLLWGANYRFGDLAYNFSPPSSYANFYLNEPFFVIDTSSYPG